MYNRDDMFMFLVRDLQLRIKKPMDCSKFTRTEVRYWNEAINVCVYALLRSMEQRKEEENENNDNA